LSNAGAGGGGVTNLNTAGAGGDLIVPTISTTVPSACFYDQYGSGIAEGGVIISGGTINGGVNGTSSNRNIFTDFSSGIGGGGGGGGTTTRASDGGNGYRGSGGGGGGSSRNGITAGLGGLGGNGYVIFAAIGV